MSLISHSVIHPRYYGFPLQTNCALIEAAVSETTLAAQIDRSLAFGAGISAISLALQGIFKVKNPLNKITPLSVLFIVNALSGDGKTAAKNSFFKSFYIYQEKAKPTYNAGNSKYKALHSSWKTKLKAHRKTLAKLEEAGECTAEIESKIQEHFKNEPIPPRKPKMIYEDTTPGAMFLGLYHDLPTAGLISDEGGMVLNGRAFGDVEKMNSLWSGMSITYDRLSKDSIEIAGVFLTIFLGVQPSALKKYLENKGEHSRGSGLWARFLVCCPKSPQGHRQFTAAEHSMEHRDKFAERLMEFIELNSLLLEEPDMPQSVIEFTTEAADLWLRVANEIEREINPGGRFAGAGDLASKLPDNIARVAALLHCFEKMPGDISVETLRTAVDICMHYADDFLSVFNPPPAYITDAAELDAWFDVRLRRHTRYVQKMYVRRYGPGKLRQSNRLEQALLHLQDNNKIAILLRGKMEVIDLWPTYPHDQDRMSREAGIANPGSHVGIGFGQSPTAGFGFGSGRLL